MNVTGEFNDSMSLLITWDPPPFSDQNGEIIKYNVSYQRTDGADEGTSVSSPDVFILIRGLTIFTNYSVSVAAVTDGGVGPHSEPIIVRTDSSSEFLNFYKLQTKASVSVGSCFGLTGPRQCIAAMATSLDRRCTVLNASLFMIRRI